MRYLDRPIAVGMLVGLLLVSLAAEAQQPAPTPGRERMIDYDGAAAFFNVDRATVVYPAKGPQGDRNRIAAERTRDYLEGKWGVLTGVSADDAVSQEQLQGHLFLLGWDNALLQDEPPFRRDGAGVDFAGARGEPGDDLLFIHRSPFNKRKYLLFWSRLDLEIARFNPVPFLGADWAWFRDYLPYHRGKLEQTATWPPKRDDTLDLQDRPAELPVRLSSAQVRVRALGSLREAELAEVLDARQRALEQAAASFDALPQDFRIDVFVYRDVETKTRLTGVPDPVHVWGPRNELHYVLDLASRPNPQREIQLVARDRFGPCSLSLFCDGLPLALMSAPQSSNDQLGMMATMLVDAGRMPETADLLHEESLRALNEQGIGFGAGGLLVQWLHEQLDREAFAKLYAADELALERLTRAAGRDAIPRFASWTEARAASARTEVRFRQALGEADRARDNGDATARVAALGQALELKPNDVQTHYRLGLALRAAGRTDEAIEQFGELAKRLERDRSTSSFLPHSHLQIGEIYFDAGDPKRALRALQTVMRLEDRRGSHEMAEELIEELESDASAGG